MKGSPVYPLGDTSAATYPTATGRAQAAPARAPSPAVGAGIPFVPQPPKDMAKMAQKGAEIPLPPQATPYAQFAAGVQPQVPGYPMPQPGAPAMPQMMPPSVQAGMVQKGMMPTGTQTSAMQQQQTGTKTGAAVAATVHIMTPEESAYLDSLTPSELSETGAYKASGGENQGEWVIEGDQPYGKLQDQMSKPKSPTPGPTNEDMEKDLLEGNFDKVMSDLEGMQEGFDEEWFNNQLQQGESEIQAQYEELLAQQQMAASIGGYGFSGAASDISGRAYAAMISGKSKLRVDLMTKQMEAQRQDKWNKLSLLYQMTGDAYQRRIVQDQLLEMQKSNNALQQHTLMLNTSIDMVFKVANAMDFDLSKIDGNAILDISDDYNQFCYEYPNATEEEKNAFLSDKISHAIQFD